MLLLATYNPRNAFKLFLVSYVDRRPAGLKHIGQGLAHTFDFHLRGTELGRDPIAVGEDHSGFGGAAPTGNPKRT